jgi:hypothetical protein
MRVQEFTNFVAERQLIFDRRASGMPKPWTQDRILQMYRFCNVQRENDTETLWIAKHWREPYQTYTTLWFALLVARFLNWHPTLAELDVKKVLNLDVLHIRKRLHDRAGRGEKVFTGAYTVSTNGRSMNKIDYVCNHVFEPAAEVARTSREKSPWSRIRGVSLEAVAGHLTLLPGLSTFMAGQVVADLKYASPYRDAPDWWDFAVPGPGSKRGLNRVFDRDVAATWPGRSWNEHLKELRAEIDKPLHRELGYRLKLHAQDVQNCLCEFDKYERVRRGEGKPRSTYSGRF